MKHKSTILKDNKGENTHQEKQSFSGSKKISSNHHSSKKKKALNEKKMQDLENLHFISKAIRSMFLDQVESLPIWTAWWSAWHTCWLYRTFY